MLVYDDPNNWILVGQEAKGNPPSRIFHVTKIAGRGIIFGFMDYRSKLYKSGFHRDFSFSIS